MPTLDDVYNFLKRKGVITRALLLFVALIMIVVLNLFKSDPIVDIVGNIVFIIMIILIIKLPTKD